MNYSNTNDSPLQLEFQQGIAIISINRPGKKNAMTADMMNSLPAILADLSGDPEIRCIILTGKNGDFCSGGDLSTALIPDVGFEEKDFRKTFSKRQQASYLLNQMQKPTIALVDGIAAGAGLSLALACDIRIASDRARFNTAFVNVGVSGDFGVTWLLPKLVGIAKAKELMFTGDTIDAAYAMSIGMVNRTVPQEELMYVGHSLAHKMARKPPHAIKVMKKNLNSCHDLDLNEVLEIEGKCSVDLLMTRETQEIIDGFLNKRSRK